jgi:excisionase family DNA binding protein
MALDLSRLAEAPAFLRVSEVAELLRISRSSAYEYIVDGRLPAVRFSSRQIRVPRSALLRLAGEQVVRNGGEQAADQQEPAGGGTADPAAEEP